MRYNLAFTEDQAMAIMVYLAENDGARAENILDFYYREYLQDKSFCGVFEGFSKAYDVISGEKIVLEKDLWSNSLLGMAVLQYYATTGNTWYNEMFADIGNFITAFSNRDLLPEYPRIVTSKELVGGYYYLVELVNAFPNLSGFNATAEKLLYTLNNARGTRDYVPYGLLGGAVVDDTFDTETHCWIKLTGIGEKVGLRDVVSRLTQYVSTDVYVKPDGGTVEVEGLAFGREMENTAISMPATILFSSVRENFQDSLLVASFNNTLPYSTREFVRLSGGEYTPFGKYSVYATALYLLARRGINPFKAQNLSGLITRVPTPVAIDNALPPLQERLQLVTTFTQLTGAKVTRAWLGEQLHRVQLMRDYLAEEINTKIPSRVQEIENAIRRLDDYIAWVEKLNAEEKPGVEELTQILENKCQMLAMLENRLESLENSFIQLENIHYQYSVINMRNMWNLLQTSDVVFSLAWSRKKADRLENTLVFHEPFMEYPSFISIENHGGWRSTSPLMPYIDEWGQSLAFENVGLYIWHDIPSIYLENITFRSFVLPAEDNGYAVSFKLGNVELGGISDSGDSLHFKPFESEGDVISGSDTNCVPGRVYKITFQMQNGKYGAEFVDHFRDKLVYKVENVPYDNSNPIENIQISFSVTATPALSYVKDILLLAGNAAGDSIHDKCGTPENVLSWVENYRQNLIQAYETSDLSLAQSVRDNQPPRGELAFALRETANDVCRVLGGNFENENLERQMIENRLENGLGLSHKLPSILQLSHMYDALTSAGWGGYIFAEDDELTFPLLSVSNAERWVQALGSDGWGQIYGGENEPLYVPSLKVQRQILSALTDYRAGGYIVPPPGENENLWTGAVVIEVENDNFVHSIPNTIRYINAITSDGWGGYIYDRENNLVPVTSIKNVQRKIDAILGEGGWVQTRELPTGVLDISTGKEITLPPETGEFIRMKDNRFYDPAGDEYWTPVIIAYQAWISPINVVKNFLQVEEDFRMIKEMGADAVRLDFPWNDIEVENGVFDFGKYDYILNLAEKHELRVFAQIGYAYPPFWAPNSWFARRLPYPTWDEVGEYTGWQVPSMSYTNPEAREALRRFMQTIAQRYRDRKNIVAWIVGCEDTFVLTWFGHQLGYEESGENAFRAWLKAQYDDNVDRLNISWSSSHTSFENLEMPSMTSGNPNVRFDLTQWRENVLADFIAFKAKSVKDTDPNHLLTYAFVSMPYIEASFGYTGEDPKKIADACANAGAPLDFIQANNYPWPLKEHERASGIFGIDVARWKSSLPVLVELGFTTTWAWRTDVTEEGQAVMLKNSMWEALFAGAIGVQVFTWEDRPQILAPEPERGFGIVSADRQPKPAYHSVKDVCTALRERSLAEMLKGEDTTPQGRVAFYWPETADEDYFRYYSEALQLAGSLKRLGIYYEFIDNLEDGENYEVVILPANPLMHPQSLEYIRDNLLPSGVNVFSSSTLPGEALFRAGDNPALDNMMREIFGIATEAIVSFKGSWRGGRVPIMAVPVTAFVGAPYYMEVVRENFLVHVTSDLGPLLSGENYLFTTWKFYQGLVDNSTTTRVAENEPDDVVFSIKTHPPGDGKAIFAAWGFDFISPSENKLDYVARTEWVKAAFENSFGIEPVLRVTDNENSDCFYIQVDYRKRSDNTVLLWVRNYDDENTYTATIESDILQNGIIEDIENGDILPKENENVVKLTIAPGSGRLLYISPAGWSYQPGQPPTPGTRVGRRRISDFEEWCFKVQGENVFLWEGPPLKVVSTSWYRIYAPPGVHPLPADVEFVENDGRYAYYKRKISSFFVEYYGVENWGVQGPRYWRWYGSPSDSLAYREALLDSGWVEVIPPFLARVPDFSSTVFLGNDGKYSYYQAGGGRRGYWTYGGEIYRRSSTGVHKFMHGISELERCRGALRSFMGGWLREPLGVMGVTGTRYKLEDNKLLRWQPSLNSIGVYLLGLRGEGSWLVEAEDPTVLRPKNLDVVSIDEKLMGRVRYRGKEYSGIFTPGVKTIDNVTRVLKGEVTPYGGFVQGAGGKPVWHPHPQDTVKLVARENIENSGDNVVYRQTVFVPIMGEGKYEFLLLGDPEEITLDDRGLMVRRKVNDVTEFYFYENSALLNYGLASRAVTVNERGENLRVGEADEGTCQRVVYSVTAYQGGTGELLRTGTETHDNAGRLVEENVYPGSSTRYYHTNLTPTLIERYENGRLEENTRLKSVLSRERVLREFGHAIPREWASRVENSVGEGTYAVYSVDLRYLRGERVLGPADTYPTVEFYPSLKVKVNRLVTHNNVDIPSFTFTCDFVTGDAWEGRLENVQGTRREELNLPLGGHVENSLPKVLWVFTERNLVNGDSVTRCYDGAHANPVLVSAGKFFTYFKYPSLHSRFPIEAGIGHGENLLARTGQIALAELGGLAIPEEVRPELSTWMDLDDDTPLLKMDFTWSQAGNRTVLYYLWGDPLGRCLVFENPAADTTSVNIYRPNSEHFDRGLDIRGGKVVREKYFEGLIPAGDLPAGEKFGDRKVPVIRVLHFLPAGSVKENRLNPRGMPEIQYLVPDDPLGRTLATYNPVFDVRAEYSYSENAVVFPSRLEIYCPSKGTRIVKEFSGLVDRVMWYRDGEVLELLVREVTQGKCDRAMVYASTGDPYGERGEVMLPGGDVLLREYDSSLFHAFGNIPLGVKTATVLYGLDFTVPVPRYIVEENRLVGEWESVTYDEERVGQVTYLYSYLNPFTGEWERWRAVYYGLERLSIGKVSFEAELPGWATALMVAVLAVLGCAYAAAYSNKIVQRRKELKRGFVAGARGPESKILFRGRRGHWRGN